MSRTDRVRQSIEHLNARDFTASAEDFAENVRFHAPGLGLDVEGRDTVTKRVTEFVEQADVRYAVQDVVERGPFVVAFVTSTGSLDGQQMTWELCEVLRYEDDQAVEIWALRGGPPRPTGS
jgi:hypothetical protein